MNADASAARLIALRQVGGLSKRLARASERCCFLRSSGVGGRPVRPRASIVPAAFPRCLVRRFRFVCAIVQVQLTRWLARRAAHLRSHGSRAAQVGRKAVERRPRREADELRASQRGVSSDRLDDLASGVDAVVLDVGRDLRDLLSAQATARSPGRPGRPSGPPSRIRAAIARASSTVAGGASSTLKATSGGRAATSARRRSGAGAAVRSRASARRPRSGAASAAGPPRAKLGARASAGECSVQEDGQLELSASRSASTSASAHAAPRSLSHR